MKKYIAILLLCSCFSAFGQVINPLDTVEKYKRTLLLKFGEDFKIHNLAERCLKSFFDNIISAQGQAREHYRILDINADTVKSIDGQVIKALNKIEFSKYILSLYSRSLTVIDLEKLHEVIKTKNGKIALARLSYKLKDEPDDYTSPFNDTKSYLTFLSLYNKEELVFANLVKILFVYIDDKATAFNSKSFN